MLCNECDKREICQTLCPEAEAYANQDYILSSEFTITEIKTDPHEKFNEWNIKKWPDFKPEEAFTRRQQEVLHALFQGKTRKEVAKSLNISIATVRSHIRYIRKRTCKPHNK